MKVEVDGKMYCVETLIFDNKRLRKEVVASAELYRLILDSLRADIEEIAECEMNIDERWALGLKYSLQIIDNYRNIVSAEGKVNHEQD